MPLSISDILDPMLKAAKKSLAKDWGKAEDFAKPELAKLAQSLVDIAALVAKKSVNKKQAASLLKIHKNTTETVLITAAGLKVVAAENAINSALAAAKDVVNKTIGFAFL
jgi:hypothetical protein